MPHEKILDHIVKRHHEGAKVSETKVELKEMGYDEKDIQIVADHFIDNIHTISSEFHKAMGDIVEHPPLIKEHKYSQDSRILLNSDRIEQLIPIVTYLLIGLFFGIGALRGADMTPFAFAFTVLYSVILKGFMLLLMSSLTFMFLHVSSFDPVKKHQDVSFKKSIWITFVLFFVIDIVMMITQKNLLYADNILSIMPFFLYMMLAILQVLVMHIYTEFEFYQVMFIVFAMIVFHFVLQIGFLHVLLYVVGVV